MFELFSLLTIASILIAVVGFGIAASENWCWRTDWHSRLTVGAGLAAVIFSTILNIIS